MTSSDFAHFFTSDSSHGYKNFVEEHFCKKNFFRSAGYFEFSIFEHFFEKSDFFQWSPYFFCAQNLLIDWCCFVDKYEKFNFLFKELKNINFSKSFGHSREKIFFEKIVKFGCPWFYSKLSKWQFFGFFMFFRSILTSKSKKIA